MVIMKISITMSLSDSSRRVNPIFCWTWSPHEFINVDSIPIDFNVRKEFVGSGFFDDKITHKNSDKKLTVRYEDSDIEDLEVDEVLRFHVIYNKLHNISNV